MPESGAAGALPPGGRGSSNDRFISIAFSLLPGTEQAFYPFYRMILADTGYLNGNLKGFLKIIREIHVTEGGNGI